MMQAPLGYPTPNVPMPKKKKNDPEFMDSIRSIVDRKGLEDAKGLGTPHSEAEKLGAIVSMYMERAEDLVFSEGEHDMISGRLQVIAGRVGELLDALNMIKEAGGNAEMMPWMKDKLTLAADYISAVGDSALHSPHGMEVEFEPAVMVVNNSEKKLKTSETLPSPIGGAEYEEAGENKMAYLQGLFREAGVTSLRKRRGSEARGMATVDNKEKKGLWDNIHAKRKRIKEGSGEKMRKPGDKGAPSAQDLKDASVDNKEKKTSCGFSEEVMTNYMEAMSKRYEIADEKD